MLVLFEVFLAPGADPASLLSAETLRETQAQVMTFDDAVHVGFSGLSPDPGGREARYIAVARRDAPWIHRVLETSEGVAQFTMQEVDA